MLPRSYICLIFMVDICFNRELVESFLQTLQEVHGDFTNSFRSLSIMSLPGCCDFKDNYEAVLTELVAQGSSVEELKKFYKPTMHPR